MSETHSPWLDERAGARADNADAIRHQKEYYVGPTSPERTVILAPCVLTDDQFAWLKEYARVENPGPWGPDVTLMQWAMEELNRRMAAVDEINGELQASEVSDG